MKQLIMEKCPTDMCHASSVLQLDKDEFMVAWFGGSHEGKPDTDIWCSYRRDGKFSAPVRLVSADEACWNPVLFRLDEKKVILFYKVGNEIASWTTFAKISTDNGHTFNAEFQLVSGDRGGRGPVRNKPIRLSDGEILAPASTEQGIWRAFVDRSEDNAATWSQSDWIEIKSLNGIGQDHLKMQFTGNSEIPVSEQSFYGRGVIQPTLWPGAESGSVHALLRSTEGAIYRSDSVDKGRTWSEAYRTNLPNNNSGIDMVKTTEGLFLVYNPIGENWGKRTPLSISYSADNGHTWRLLRHLEEVPGEYAYPAIIAGADTVYITYTYNRENIAFCCFRKEELINE